MKIISNLLISCSLLFPAQDSPAQYKVSFLVKQPTVANTAEHVFITGNFNGWNAGDPKFQMDANKNAINLLLPAGDYEYKFTRGNWQTVETTSAGTGIANRTVTISADTTIAAEIGGWQDEFPQADNGEKEHTASPNVKIIDTAFFIPQLNRNRRIWIYLPPAYDMSAENYPVLYMHDGQNLFDDATSYAGEWGIDEYLDSIASSGKKEVIVVGIDNGLNRRLNEYNPYSTTQFGVGEGDKYVDFLVKTLKPFIDKHYRTSRGTKNTYIAGSSMGGLISLYAVLKYPSVFGAAGIFSPAFRAAPGINQFVISKAKNVKTRLFFYAGEKEGKAMVLDMKKIEEAIRERSATPMHEIIDAEAQHNEHAWRKYFPAFYEWAIIGTGK